MPEAWTPSTRAEEDAADHVSEPRREREDGELLHTGKSGGDDLRAVHFLALYRIAGSADWACLVIGCVGAVVRGVCLPLFTLLVSLIVDAAGTALTTQDIVAGVNEVSRGNGFQVAPSMHHSHMIS